MKEQINAGHRKRLRNKYIKNGIDSLTDHEILELMLFYSIPRKNTNHIAHRLIKKFGSLAAVFDATPDALLSVDGVGEATVAFIKLIPDLWGEHAYGKRRTRERLDSFDKIGAYLVDRFKGASREQSMLLFLDNQRGVIDCRTVSKGSVNNTHINIRNAVELAFSCNASSVVIAHNHPLGILEPSNADVMTTRELSRAFDAVSINFLEHFIVNEEGYLGVYEYLRRRNEQTIDTKSRDFHSFCPEENGNEPGGQNAF